LTELSLPNVIAETQTANRASCKLIERLGMKLEKTIERFGAEHAIYSIKLD
jgi:[ribosomal protein S5]-alanine N-acetyltransferase